jgi:Mg/Co/Ni transporter MgtE
LAALPEPRPQVRQVVAEVMTRQVVALPEDADVADAGRLMLERRIKSIPVVRGREVVGIVARRDLLAVLARGDEEVAREVQALLAAELGLPCPCRVTVRDGVVDLTGPPDPVDRRLATLLARGVPGVLEVRWDEE